MRRTVVTFPSKNHREVIISVVLIAAYLISIAVITTWAGASGWIDGADPFPGIDLIPDWLEGR